MEKYTRDSHVSTGQYGSLRDLSCYPRASPSSLAASLMLLPSYWPPQVHRSSCLRAFVFAVLLTWNEPLRFPRGWLPPFPHISTLLSPPKCRLLWPSSMKCQHHPLNFSLSPLLYLSGLICTSSQYFSCFTCLLSMSPPA